MLQINQIREVIDPRTITKGNKKEKKWSQLCSYKNIKLPSTDSQSRELEDFIFPTKRMRRNQNSYVYKPTGISIKIKLMSLYKIGCEKGIDEWKAECMKIKSLKPLLKSIFTNLPSIKVDHFQTLDTYSKTIVDPLVSHYMILKRQFICNNNMKEGIEFHRRFQSVLTGCKTLLDIVTLAFGPGLFGENHKISTALKRALVIAKIATLQEKRDDKSINHKEYDCLALKDAKNFILNCASAFGMGNMLFNTKTGSSAPDNTWLSFASSVTVETVIEMPTHSKSHMTNYQQARKPDVVIYACCPKSPLRIWQCVLELKTDTKYRKLSRIQYLKRKLRNIIASFNFTEKESKNWAYMKKAVFQAVDTTLCVNNNLRLKGWSSPYKIFTSTFLLYGSKTSLKSRRPKSPVFMIELCRLPSEESAFYINRTPVCDNPMKNHNNSHTSPFFKAASNVVKKVFKYDI